MVSLLLLLLLLLLLVILLFLSSMSTSFSFSFFSSPNFSPSYFTSIPSYYSFLLFYLFLSSLTSYCSSGPFSCSESLWINHSHSLVLFCRLIWRNHVDLMCNIGVNEIRNLTEQLAVLCRAVPCHTVVESLAAHIVSNSYSWL